MRFIDLFAGCGGFSTGFEMAGFTPMLAIEQDEWACDTYRYNHPKTKVLQGDIKEISQILELEMSALGLSKGDVDVIIGGPPCQGFSLSGKRDPKDPRNNCFKYFNDFIHYYEPMAFVMENVPSLLSAKTQNGENVSEIIMKELQGGTFGNPDYNVMTVVLNAAEFGVPQKRERLFFIGLRSDLPFSKYLAPKGFLFGDEQITVEQAIMDLPQIEAGQGAEIQKYPCDITMAPYQNWARRNSDNIHNHIAMKHSDRIIERFKHIGFGESVSDVDPKYGQRKRGDAKNLSGKSYNQNNFRPHPDKPSPTVPASFQSNFIHPYLNRNFTAREGARLQSFPDRYVFKGERTTMSWEKRLSQYQQIGNAVPPLLAKGIAEHLEKYLNTVIDYKFFGEELWEDPKITKERFFKEL